MRGRRRISRWLHARCEEVETSLLRERDHVETSLGRLQKAYDNLLSAHNNLIAATTNRGAQDTFSKMLSSMFEEQPLAEGEGDFLTPTLQEREGVA